MTHVLGLLGDLCAQRLNHEQAWLLTQQFTNIQTSLTSPKTSLVKVNAAAQNAYQK